MKIYYFLLLTFLFFSCERSSSPQKKQIYKPSLPNPVNVEPQKTKVSVDSANPQDELLNHPWVKQQGVTDLSTCMIDDVESMKRAYHLQSEYARQKGMIIPTYEEESLEICRQLTLLQRSLGGLKFSFPASAYSLMNIPDTPQSEYGTPYPFHIYKRVYLGLTELGLPFYEDVRVFDLPREADKIALENALQEIVDWHVKLLVEDSTIERIAFADGFLLLGKGKRNLAHFDHSHGFAMGERGLFAAFIPQGTRVYVLFAEGTWNDFLKYRKELVSTLNRDKVLDLERLMRYH